MYAVIYSTPGSYVIKCTKQNNISYGMDFSKASVSGIKPNYRYTGKTIKPSVTVKLGGQVLKKDRDYQVSYRNNKQVGTATITITGKGNYTGSITKNFAIKYMTLGKGKMVKVSGAYYKITRSGSSMRKCCQQKE